MKFKYLTSAALSAISLGLLCGAPAFADGHAGAGLSAETIHKQIAYLASDELRGRGSGEPGNEKAARFVAESSARRG